MRAGPRVLFLLFLAAGAIACYHEEDYLPSSPGTQNSLVLTLSATSVSADGFSRVDLTAQISPDAADNRRTVIFETDKGTIVAGDNKDETQRSVPADSAGVARAQLQSSNKVETALISARVQNGDDTIIKKEATVDFVAVSPSDIIRFSTNRATAPADGATIVQLIAQISPDLPPPLRRTVAFTTTLGVFVPSGPAPCVGDEQRCVPADASNLAVADLRSPSNAVGEAFLTASVDPNGPTSARTSVQFTRAFPDTVLVVTDKTTIDKSTTDKLVVTVQLLRDIGKVTVGTVVELTAEDSAGQPINFFTTTNSGGAFISNMSGVVTANWAPGAVAADGTATIRATVRDSNGATVASGQASVLITP